MVAQLIGQYSTAVVQRELRSCAQYARKNTAGAQKVLNRQSIVRRDARNMLCCGVLGPVGAARLFSRAIRPYKPSAAVEQMIPKVPAPLRQVDAARLALVAFGHL